MVVYVKLVDEHLLGVSQLGEVVNVHDAHKTHLAPSTRLGVGVPPLEPGVMKVDVIWNLGVTWGDIKELVRLTFIYYIYVVDTTRVLGCM